ncbi:unnamed protein product [Meganyctiphanes norvegica]|uniref:Nuclear receptor 2C2-associated protein n=1 Tax=Meganyctiphanes norvegica TaxID=48144 RepID=A0AAV2R184_MEGNR
MTSLVGECESRVSSVLARNTKELGKQHMFDGHADTCWNSDQGTPQWIMIRWQHPVVIKSLVGQFQGGFCGGHDTIIEGSDGNGKWQELAPWHLEDKGTEQILELSQSPTISKIKITFNTSTDFHGRIIIYKLDIIGNKSL